MTVIMKRDPLQAKKKIFYRQLMHALCNYDGHKGDDDREYWLGEAYSNLKELIQLEQNGGRQVTHQSSEVMPNV